MRYLRNKEARKVKRRYGMLLHGLASRVVALFADLHGQDDAELGLTAGHPRVGLVDLVERKLFYHRSDAG